MQNIKNFCKLSKYKKYKIGLTLIRFFVNRNMLDQPP